MHTKSFLLSLLLAVLVGQLYAQQRHPHTDRIERKVADLSKRLRTGNVDDLFHPSANIETEKGRILSPRAYYQEYQVPLQGWSIKTTGKPTYYQPDPETGEWRAKVSAAQKWGKKKDDIPCMITFLVRPKQVLILDVMNQNSAREEDFGAIIKEADVDSPPPPSAVPKPLPPDIPSTAAADCSKVLADLNRSQGEARGLRNTLVGVQQRNGILSGENTSFRQQLTQWKTRYIQDSTRWKSVYDTLKKKYDRDQPRLKRYREKELRDSLIAVARKRRAEAARVSNDSAVAKYERAYRDFYEVKPPIKPDSLNRAIHDVIDVLVANDSFLSPKALLIMAKIFGRSEGGAWLYNGPVPGTGGQDMKDAPDRRNPVTIGYIARGIEMADSLNDLQIKQEFQEILRNFPEYVRAGMGTDPPAKSLDEDIKLFFEDKDYLTAANEIRQHLPYLNDTIYTTTPDGRLINAKIKYAYGCILLWNLSDINGSKGLLSSNRKFLEEVNDRVSRGEKYLLEVIAMKQYLSKEARTLLENGASLTKIKKDKSLNSQEIKIVEVILDAKTALYKHYQ
jgi:hypothetical protein